MCRWAEGKCRCRKTKTSQAEVNFAQVQNVQNNINQTSFIMFLVTSTQLSPNNADQTAFCYFQQNTMVHLATLAPSFFALQPVFHNFTRSFFSPFSLQAAVNCSSFHFLPQVTDRRTMTNAWSALCPHVWESSFDRRRGLESLSSNQSTALQTPRPSLFHPTL